MALIITNKKGEALRLGDDVTITVLSVVGNQVKIGISAPKEVEVHREEVYEHIQKQQPSSLMKRLTTTIRWKKRRLLRPDDQLKTRVGGVTSRVE